LWLGTCPLSCGSG